ncbi:serine hydrolase domain-containing protein [Sphingomonas oleivorans]|uniref:serine hydrolase domain-containing protein n=1 Tax=Sphingomonas oleivorans TaxID=1735121 RepID=UPI0013FD5F82|nr:serine hydrolase domain-containing protein [Sphingomonas oleivorans]
MTAPYRFPVTDSRGRRHGGRGFPFGILAEIGIALLLVVGVLVIGRYHALRNAAPERAVLGKAGPPLERPLAVPPPADVSQVAAVSSTSSDIDYRRIDARLKALMARNEMVGLGIVVIENGAFRFLKGYGTTVAGGAEPVTPDTVFRWASVSKGVASTMLAELAAEKKLSLGDSVAAHAPSLHLPDGMEKEATVTDLLSQRLGIVKNAYDDRLEGDQDPYAIRGMLASLDRYCRPGTCWTYQNVAYDAASEIVERVTGKDYGAVVKARLFDPLGMKSASMTREGLIGAKSWAKPHQGRNVLEVKEAYYRVPAAGGVNSSIRDLGLWMRAQMGEAPKVLPKSVLWTIHLPRIFTTTPRSRMADYDLAMERPSYGLGWRDSVYQGHRLIGHRGAVSGYRSLILFDPERRSGVAMLWNSSTSRPAGLPLEIFDMLYGLPAKDWLQLDGKRH